VIREVQLQAYPIMAHRATVYIIPYCKRERANSQSPNLWCILDMVTDSQTVDKNAQLSVFPFTFMIFELSMTLDGMSVVAIRY
jgi:hypothetical protein